MIIQNNIEQHNIYISYEARWAPAHNRAGHGWRIHKVHLPSFVVKPGGRRFYHGETGRSTGDCRIIAIIWFN